MAETQRFKWPIPPWDADWQKWQEMFQDLVANMDATVFATMEGLKLLIKALPDVGIVQVSGKWYLRQFENASLISRTHMTETVVPPGDTELKQNSAIGLTFTPGMTGPQSITWEVFDTGMDVDPEITPLGYIDENYQIIWYNGAVLNAANSPQHLFSFGSGGGSGSSGVFVLGAGTKSAKRYDAGIATLGDYTFGTGRDNVIGSGSHYSAVFGGGDSGAGEHNQIGVAADSPHSFAAGQGIVINDSSNEGFNFAHGQNIAMDTRYANVFGKDHAITVLAAQYAHVSGNSHTIGDSAANYAGVFGDTHTLGTAGAQYALISGAAHTFTGTAGQYSGVFGSSHNFTDGSHFNLIAGAAIGNGTVGEVLTVGPTLYSLWVGTNHRFGAGANYNAVTGQSHVLQASGASHNAVFGFDNHLNNGANSQNIVGGGSNVLAYGSASNVVGGTAQVVTNSSGMVVGGNNNALVDTSYGIVVGDSNTLGSAGNSSAYCAVFGNANNVATTIGIVYSLVAGTGHTVDATAQIIGGSGVSIQNNSYCNAIVGNSINVSAYLSNSAIFGGNHAVAGGGSLLMAGDSHTLLATIAPVNFAGIFGQSHTIDGSDFGVVGGADHELTNQTNYAAVFGASHRINYSDYIVAGGNAHEVEPWREGTNVTLNTRAAGMNTGLTISFSKSFSTITMTDTSAPFTPDMEQMDVTISGTVSNDGDFNYVTYISPTQISWTNGSGATEGAAAGNTWHCLNMELVDSSNPFNWAFHQRYLSIELSGMGSNNGFFTSAYVNSSTLYYTNSGGSNQVANAANRWDSRGYSAYSAVFGNSHDLVNAKQCLVSGWDNKVSGQYGVYGGQNNRIGGGRNSYSNCIVGNSIEVKGAIEESGIFGSFHDFNLTDIGGLVTGMLVAGTGHEFNGNFIDWTFVTGQLNTINDSVSYGIVSGYDNEMGNSTYSGIMGTGNTIDSTSSVYVIGATNDARSMSSTLVSGSLNKLNSCEISIVGGARNENLQSNTQGAGTFTFASNTWGANSGTGISFNFNGGTVTLTDAGAGFTTVIDGATIDITNAPTAGNNGSFTLQYLNSNQVIYENPSGASETGSVSTAWQIDYATLFDSTTPWVSGRSGWVNISNAVSGANNGQFRVLSGTTSSTLWYVNPSVVPEAGQSTTMWQDVGGSANGLGVFGSNNIFGALSNNVVTGNSNYAIQGNCGIMVGTGNTSCGGGVVNNVVAGERNFINSSGVGRGFLGGRYNYVSNSGLVDGILVGEGNRVSNNGLKNGIICGTENFVTNSGLANGFICGDGNYVVGGTSALISGENLEITSAIAADRSVVAGSGHWINNTVQYCGIFGFQHRIENMSRALFAGDQHRVTNGGLYAVMLGEHQANCPNNKGTSISLSFSGGTVTMTDLKRFQPGMGTGSFGITISGATNGGNNGAFFPITYIDENTISFPNPSGVTESANPNLSWVMQSGGSDNAMMFGENNGTWNGGSQNGLILGCGNTGFQNGGDSGIILGLDNIIYNSGGARGIITGQANTIHSGGCEVLVGGNNNLGQQGFNQSIMWGSYCRAEASCGYTMTRGVRAEPTGFHAAHVVSGGHPSDVSLTADTGQAQNFTHLPFCGQTTNANPTIIYSDGIGQSQNYGLNQARNADRAWLVITYMIAKCIETGSVKSWRFETMLNNVGGVLSVVSYNKLSVGQTNPPAGGEASWDADIIINGVELAAQVTGAASETVRWQAFSMGSIVGIN